MKILMTGAAGFIASHVADACIAAGHRVTIIDDMSMGKPENINPQAEFHKLDIRSPEVARLFGDGRFDAVIHHAAQMDVRKSVSDPIFDASVNILGTINLLEASRTTGVKKVIFASTGGAIYGDQDYFPADEEHPLRPVSPYGISKLAVEKYLHYYRLVHGLQGICLRYANVYGPRQNPHGEAGVIAIFTSRLLAGQTPVINGDGLQTRDYVYIDDVVAANLYALASDRSDIYNVGTGIETTVNQLFEHLRSLTGMTCTAVHAEAKKGEQLRSVLSTAKLQKTFGWKTTVDLREGLRRTVEFFRQKSG
ncbi:MAG TPA: NAD-dependent epimerase/dehydratase family protein [Bacteroidota bacterium]|nr:NAD-dependent epimerase/dehydratase family protein [Bacteroidota bacterium]